MLLHTSSSFNPLKDTASYRANRAWRAKIKRYSDDGYQYKKSPILPVSLKRQLISTQSKEVISPLI